MRAKVDMAYETVEELRSDIQPTADKIASWKEELSLSNQNRGQSVDSSKCTCMLAAVLYLCCAMIELFRAIAWLPAGVTNSDGKSSYGATDIRGYAHSIQR
eukprot:COSAG05_NODE_733_length_7644_cov_43.682704_5_plen_101_part_00